MYKFKYSSVITATKSVVVESVKPIKSEVDRKSKRSSGTSVITRSQGSQLKYVLDFGK